MDKKNRGSDELWLLDNCGGNCGGTLAAQRIIKRDATSRSFGQSKFFFNAPRTMSNTPIPTRGPGDVSQVYSDDWSDKEVFLQATGLYKDSDPSNPRHVLIYWVNAALGGGIEVWDITQLAMHGHWHQYHYPNALKVNSKERTRNHTISLGIFTPEQREQLLELAADIEYDQITTESRVWMRELLAKMVEENLISLRLFKSIREDVPLPCV